MKEDVSTNTSKIYNMTYREKAGCIGRGSHYFASQSQRKRGEKNNQASRKICCYFLSHLISLLFIYMYKILTFDCDSGGGVKKERKIFKREGFTNEAAELAVSAVRRSRQR